MSDRWGMSRLQAAAERLADSLQRTTTKIVFAESCTGGLVAATLATVPGVSRYHCGSMVTYRGETKIAWLGLNEVDVRRDDAVNETVAAQMAARVLQQTPESNLALSITGHLGPGAPPALDGVAFIGSACSGDSITTEVLRVELETQTRRERQIEAATRVLMLASDLALRHSPRDGAAR